MTKKDLIKVMVIAARKTISLPGYLYLRGLPLPWALALFASYLAVTLLGYLYHED